VQEKKENKEHVEVDLMKQIGKTTVYEDKASAHPVSQDEHQNTGGKKDVTTPPV